MKIQNLVLVALFLLMLLFFLPACGSSPMGSELSSEKEVVSPREPIVVGGEFWLYVTVPLDLSGSPTNPENAEIIGQMMIAILENNPGYTLVSMEVYWRPKSTGFGNYTYGLGFLFKK